MVERSMVESYSSFAKGLAIVSTGAVVAMSAVALVANLLGGVLITAFLIVCLAGFLKVLAFAFEPTALMTYSGEPEREPEEWVEAYASHFEGETKLPATPDRILPESGNQDLVATARIIGGSPTQKRVPVDEVEAERRKEDREWADMFRAL